MSSDIVTIGLSFIEGIALIASPCILPILPIILAGSLTGSKKRPFGIIAGFIAFFTLFTFFSRALVQHSGVDINLIRHASYLILVLLGVVMISTYLTDKLNQLMQGLLSTGSQLSIANDAQGGFFSGVLFGGIVAIIWTPCAGPILAAVIVQTIVQQTTLISFLTLLSFGIGVAVPMFLIALYGRTIISKMSFVKNHTSLFRKILGLIIILSVGYLISLEAGIVGVGTVQSTSAAITTSDKLINPLPESYPAPEIAGIDTWINSAPLTIADLKGKVVLIDFWTYSCINCIRTLPYIKGWYEKYHDKGLVIIGIHAPEFDFEKEVSNVKNAVAQFGIKYPVALDNQFVTWRNYLNRYWPAHYLIDKSGNVVYTHFGEGEYDVTENNIRYLLGLNQEAKREDGGDNQFFESMTPETYLGYERADHYAGNQKIVKDALMYYTSTDVLAVNDWALQGTWKVLSDRIVSASSNATISIHFKAKDVYAVMGGVDQKPISLGILLNGQLPGVAQGKDVKNGVIFVNKHRLYSVIHFTSLQEGVLTLTAPTSGFELYTFTFGG